MYESKSFEHLIGMEVLSDKLLEAHFGLYEGYVKNTNLLSEKLTQLATDGQTAIPEYSELKRRFGWEFNGMRLHEYYFENMTKENGGKHDESQGIVGRITEQFGSMDQWREEFISTGKMRGIGWVILAYDERGGRLFNTWINEHDLGFLAGAKPLLVMDVFEHAFVMDFGMDRGAYIDAFFKLIDWGVVDER